MYEAITLKCLIFEKIAFLNFGVMIQDGGSPPSNSRNIAYLISVPDNTKDEH